MRPGRQSLNPESEEQKLFLQTTVARGMSESWSKYFDDLRFSIIAHKKISVMQFPLGEKILLITSDSYVPLTIAEDIFELIKKHKN